MGGSVKKSPTVSDLNRGSREGRCSDASTFWDYFKGHNRALEAAGLSVNRVVKYTTEELIVQLQAAQGQLGRTPSFDLMNVLSEDGEFACGSTFSDHFGTFPKALRAAGFIPHRGQTREEIITQLRQLGHELGRKPTRDDLEAASKRKVCVSRPTLIKVFGTQSNALKAAGFEV